MFEKKLTMTFQPTVIEHLGVKMYSHTVPAIAELVANAYDACATEVIVELFDNQQHKIVIRDNGIGMSFDEVNDFYLRIGRNRRKEKQISSCERKPTGKKGLGKLALFGLGNKIAISTVRNNERVDFTLNYNDILTSQGDYHPNCVVNHAYDSPNGTVITLTELSKKQNYSLESYVSHLARLFNFPDSNFIIKMSLNGNTPQIIDNKLKYKSIIPEFEWNYLEVVDLIAKRYKFQNLINGTLLTTEKPLKNNMKGVTLFANGRMVNAPEFFRDSESSHFYSYFTGWLNVDFIDDNDEDLISTDRTSLDWKHPIASDLKDFLADVVSYIERDWRKKRKEKREQKVREKSGIDRKAWHSKLPSNIKESVQTILEGIDDSGLETEAQVEIEQALHTLVPEYPYYHWRHLHKDIHDACYDYYNNRQDYLSAAIEAVKVFEDKVQNRTGIRHLDGHKLFETAFGSKSSILLLTSNNSQSEKNLEDGLEKLACGIWTGFRNPIQHDLRINLYPNVFNDMDALDLLSLVSYLLRKVEQTQKR